MSERILICEDDTSLAERLQRLLREQGFTVETVASGAGALARIEKEPPHLLLLDFMLPDMDGFDVCRRLRAKCAMPVIMLSGTTEDIERIIALEVGADDVLCKPFAMQDLISRITAKIRRSTTYARCERPVPVVQVGELCVDLAARRVQLKETPIHLTPKEFDLLAALAQEAGKVVRSADLLLRVWGYGEGIRTRTLDVHIGRLRAKIEHDTRRPRYIHTVLNVGYRLSLSAEAKDRKAA